ncbi:MAG: hypothetical protein BGO63_15325 [Candidatus Accumulibacter sp. 66-26]|nr:MAG: hypothetical protein BGO63_15325 [Candidatus Accumulibacter sp. 66-26]
MIARRIATIARQHLRVSHHKELAADHFLMGRERFFDGTPISLRRPQFQQPKKCQGCKEKGKLFITGGALRYTDNPNRDDDCQKQFTVYQ